MRQVLFHIPILKEQFPPDGIPVNAFGVMLFITFVVCVWILGRLAAQWGTNLPKERVQDTVIVTFLGGLIGARITFMIVEGRALNQFFRIWEGGIVLYGGVIAGMLIFLLFYRWVLKKYGVSFWKLADAAGPSLAVGIALGRIGCFLNGCCYGHVAPEGCPSAPFPLLTCPARDVVVDRQAYQTPTGFTVRSNPDDIRSVVDRVEPQSAAERAGLLPGDRIVKVNSETNGGVLVVVSDDPQARNRAAELAQEQNAVVDREREDEGRIRIVVDDLEEYRKLHRRLNGELPLRFRARVLDVDVFTDRINLWPRGRESLDLDVERAGQVVHVGPFTPRTLGLHPTQVYETISMLSLTALLLAFYPFRRHDGQVFTLFVALYAIHRFLNESLRNDTEIVGFPQLRMSLSQNISILMLLFAAALEIGLRKYGKTRVNGPGAQAGTSPPA